MSRDKNNVTTPPIGLASLVRGLYGRVADQLDLDPSYVSRVARGERNSDVVEEAIEREIRRIMLLVKVDGNHNHHNHRDGHHSAGSKAKSTKKGNKKSQ